MPSHYFLFINAGVLSVVYLWLFSFVYRDNKKHIKIYNPIIYPVFNFFNILQEALALFMLGIMFTGYSTIISDKPLIYMSVAIVIIVFIVWFIYRKQLIPYFLNDKILLWQPRFVNSEMVEIEIKDVEAFILQYTTKGKKIGSINLKVNNVSKSFSVSLREYKLNDLIEYFSIRDKPVFQKSYGERTAKRIN